VMGRNWACLIGNSRKFTVNSKTRLQTTSPVRFAVHGVSMNKTNRLVSGDNKGYASMAFEYQKNPNHRPGKGPFVAAFASSHGGDSSPNIEGAKCRGGPHEGENCDFANSTCGGYPDEDFATHCYALGPGDNGDMEHSTEIIGERQYLHAWELYHRNASEFVQVSGPLQHAHQHVNMNNFKVWIYYLFKIYIAREYIDEVFVLFFFQFNYTAEIGNPVESNTCPAALGYSFAAGCEDGSGMFNFTQGDVTGDPFWDRIRDFLKVPTEEQVICHA